MIGVSEIILIGLVLAIIFVLPSKLPEFVKAVKEAGREFKASSSGEDRFILDTAERLGISVEGKTMTQIVEEVAERIRILKQEFSKGRSE